MKKGSGFADWETFSRHFKPILLTSTKQLGRPPKHRELRQLGFGRFVSACYHHHGGYANVLRRLGYLPAKRIRVTSLLRAVERQHQKDQRFRERLTHLFPDHVQLGIAPSSTAVLHRDEHLRYQMLKSRDGYAGTCQRLGLLPFSVGRKVWTQATAIVEAWTYVRRYGRWPTARACSNSLRHLRFQRARMTWYRSFMISPLPAGVARYLLEHGELHGAWLRQHRPVLVSVHQRYLAWLHSHSST